MTIQWSPAARDAAYRLSKNVSENQSVQQRATGPCPYDPVVTPAPRADPIGLPDELAPEPVQLTGASIGYARVSTTGQILDRQTRALTDAVLGEARQARRRSPR